MRMIRIPLLIALAAVAAACSYAPRSGPTGAAVRSAASAPEEAIVPFAFAPLTPETVATLEARRAETPEEDFAETPRENAQILRVGDVVEVSIWEAVDGGLFSSEAAGMRSVALPPQRLGPSGTLAVPYAGRIRAAGRTPEQVSEAVTEALQGKAIEPQVLVTVGDSPVSAVTVIGDAAAQSGRIPLAGVGERVLDVIAAAGGSKVAAHRTLVRLTRDGRQAETHLARILREPPQNVRVRPGDVVALLESERTYTVLGSALRPQRVPFSTEVVTLDEALAEAGGLVDLLADPEAIFVFRYENAELAEELTGIPVAGAQAPVVYNLDLSEPGSFFLARRFEVAEGDIIYTANAPITDLRKVLSVVSQVVAPTTSTLRLADAASN